MPDLEVENLDETDFSDNEENHFQLLNSIIQLDSTQRVKPAERKEIASEVSEYNLTEGVTSKKNLISVKELARVLDQKSQHGVFNKKIQKIIEKAKTLPKPMEKLVEDRLKRSVGFENVKKQLSRWNAVVARNALKDQITFPLNDNSTKMHKSNEFLSQFKTPTPLEKEIARVLKQENMEEKEIENNEFPLTLEEMMEKRREMAQLRAKLSYKQTKAQRQSKIKSKKYHRLLKREKLRQQLKEFEILQKTDPEAALKKLSELDITRAKERASLRHRNTGQWAKNLNIRAKYDVETRKILAEQLTISRELTQKISKLDSSDDEESAKTVLPDNTLLQQDTSAQSDDNPWVLNVSKEVQDFVSGYKKFWSEKEKEVNQKKLNDKEKKMKTNQNNLEEEETAKEINKNESVKMEEGSNDKNNKKNSKLIQNVEILKVDEIQQKLPKIISPVNSARMFKPNRKDEVKTVHSSSGIWKVTPIITKLSSQNNKNNTKVEDIDTLFDELNDKLMKTAAKKIKVIGKKLKKSKKRKQKLEKRKDLNAEFDLSLKNKNVVERPDLNVGLLENGVEDNVFEMSLNDMSVNAAVNESKSKHEPAIIDPKKFIQVKPKRLRTHLPENITGGEESLDDEKSQQMIIEEAFGEDDVLAEFKEMKEEEEKSSKVEIETSLPGWGEWGGTGIIPNPRKKRLLILNLPPRKDKLMKDVIINENENPSLKTHLVKEVPHPFKSVEAFEANIRAPVGRDWVPETAHQKLVEKQVVTKLGTIIEPMSEEEIVRLKKAPKSPYRGLKKKKYN